MSRLITTVLCIAAAVLPLSITAQQTTAPPTIKRTPLQKLDVPGSPNMEVITGTAEIVPNANIGRHTHFGAETGYVIEGTLTLLVEGKPPVTLKPGDSYQIPASAIHDAKAGEGGAKVLAVYVVEKGKPLASPAP
jgi:quercetin dioxygenase-like cupin family protein